MLGRALLQRAAWACQISARSLSGLGLSGAKPPPSSAGDAEAHAAVAAANRELNDVFGSVATADPTAAPAEREQGSGPLAEQALAAQGDASPQQPRLTHFDREGRAAMVDVGGKASTRRVARASGRVELGPAAFALLQQGANQKGSALGVAQIAGIMGAKQTSSLIPLCHPLALSKVSVDLALDEAHSAVAVTAEAATRGPTGVEMEALTAVSVAALALYDMCKAASKDIVISDIRLEAKEGGRSGQWQRQGHAEAQERGSGGENIQGQAQGQLSKMEGFRDGPEEGQAAVTGQGSGREREELRRRVSASRQRRRDGDVREILRAAAVEEFP